MSIGYGSVGEASVGENVDLGLVDILMPSKSVAVVGNIPVLQTGRTIDIPAGTIATIAAIPVASGGANVEILFSQSVSIPSNAPDVAGGGSVTSPASAIAVVKLVPDVDGGAIVTVPVSTAESLIARAPTLFMGTLVDAAARSINVVGVVPQILQSANIPIPAGILSVQILAPGNGGGAFVDNPSRQDTFQSLAGSIGADSVGEFGVAEGHPETVLSGRRAARLPLIAQQPVIQAGKLFDIPSAAVIALGRVPEIDSRSRRLRTQTILS